ncbi:MAG: glutaredoxin family protein [Lentisphaeria bacterium]|nr:glutaredoxin family protein [Lentisphaeria bacterium]
MLKVYGWNQCPHTRHAVAWLKEHDIPFEYLEIEEQPKDVIRKVVEVNGGDDWVVPTLEYNGRWRPGEVFNPAKLEQDLKKLGVL